MKVNFGICNNKKLNSAMIEERILEILHEIKIFEKKLKPGIQGNEHLIGKAFVVFKTPL
jgi:hypothetical protein